MSDHDTTQAPPSSPEPEAHEPGAAPREGLLLPILLPVGGLALIGLVLFLFSRILLHITHDAATVVACVTAGAIITVCTAAASRERLSNASLLPMIGTIVGIALVAGGVAMVAIGPEKEEVQPQAVTLTAPAGAASKGFQQKSLTLEADRATTLTFDNQDPNVSHNVVIFKGKDANGETEFTGALTSGPSNTPYAVPALPAGSYFFHCQVHPTTMTGTITVEVAAAPSGSGSGPPPPAGPVISATGLQFNEAQLNFTADEPTVLTFTNNDAGTQHNVDIYKDSAFTDSLFKGDLVTGPDTVQYQVPALPAGTYYFKCDVHPTMTGTLVAAPTPGGGGAGGGGSGSPGSSAPSASGSP